MIFYLVGWFNASACVNSLKDCQVGLNFSDEGEAEIFQNAVVEKISQRNNRQGQHLFCGDYQIES